MQPNRVMLFALIIAGAANAQLTGRGIDFDKSFDTSEHEEGPIAALEEEINRLNRAAAFDKTALQKEIDDLRIELGTRDQIKFRKVTYRSTDGLAIPAYLFEPETTGQYPALVDVHGGQHGSVSSRSLQRTIDWVQSGYVILAPDYRGSSGYSESYYNKADSVNPHPRFSTYYVHNKKLRIIFYS
jgi:cephalosporin-C deacetylase-like acetyl esterase